jgi:Mrp family chromosome partitioning ATPase
LGKEQARLSKPTKASLLGSSTLSETFRLLALTLNQVLAPDERRVTAIMSAYPGDGRSLAAALLARSLAELDSLVVLLDADPVGAGLNGLTAELTASAPSLQLLNLARDGVISQASYAARLQVEIEDAAASGATVVIDTPACAVSSLAFHVATRATGVVYLARRRPGDGQIHREIRAQLDRLHARVLGVVFNEA